MIMYGVVYTLSGHAIFQFIDESTLKHKTTRHNLEFLIIPFSVGAKDNSERANRFRAEAMFILASIINLGKSGLAKNNVTEDDLDR